MRRVGLVLVLSLAVGLTLLAGAASASQRHPGFHSGFHGGHVTIFIGHGHPFVHHPFLIHHPFVHPGLFHPHLRSPVFVPNPVIVVQPAPQPVWVPGFWQWDGFQWIWVPGHWAFPAPALVPRNPCD